MKTLCALILSTYAFTGLAFAERYLVALRAKLVTTAPSIIADPESPTTFLSASQTQRQFIKAVLKRTPVPADPRAFTLVYDSDRDSLDIVWKANGVLLSSVVQFATVQSVQAELSPAKVHRLASMTITGVPQPTGTAVGFRKTDGSKWTASFIVAIPSDPPINLTGTFTTGKAFVPSL